MCPLSRYDNEGNQEGGWPDFSELGKGDLYRFMAGIGVRDTRTCELIEGDEKAMGIVGEAYVMLSAGNADKEYGRAVSDRLSRRVRELVAKTRSNRLAEEDIGDVF